MVAKSHEETVAVMSKKLEDYVITIPDFPEPGIMFRDVTGILQDAEGLHLSIDTLVDMVKDLDFDVIVGAESRGFIFGAPMADRLEVEYDLEYGTAILQMHKDAIKPGQKVVIVDDLIATGGTVEAICRLVEQLGGEVVKLCFVLELAGLKGREKLAKYDVQSAIIYEGK